MKASRTRENLYGWREEGKLVWRRRGGLVRIAAKKLRGWKGKWRWNLRRKRQGFCFSDVKDTNVEGRPGEEEMDAGL